MATSIKPELYIFFEKSGGELYFFTTLLIYTSTPFKKTSFIRKCLKSFPGKGSAAQQEFRTITEKHEEWRGMDIKNYLMSNVYIAKVFFAVEEV